MNKRFFATIFSSIAICCFFANQALANDVVVSSSYVDTNADGRIDHLKWVFDEPITQCIFEARDWTVDVMGDMKIAITGINTGDPEGTGEGSCNGTDSVIYLSVTADEKKTGSVRSPLISYKNRGANNSIQDVNSIISDKSRQEQSDGAMPLITGASLDFNNTASQFSVNFSEPITLVKGGAGFYINDITKEDDTALLLPIHSEDGVSLTFQLNEERLAYLLEHSGVTGGDQSPLILDVDKGAVNDTSASKNVNKASNNIIINEIPDTTAPKLKEWYIDLNKNQIILTFSEYLDLSTFVPTTISIQKSENSSSDKVTLTGGGMIDKGGGIVALDLNTNDMNSIISKPSLATSSSNAFLAVTNNLVDDLAKNSNVAISSSSALQASSYIGKGNIGKLTRTHILLSSNRMNERTGATISFEIENDLPSDGKIEIVFPPEFTLGDTPWAEAVTGIDGNLDVSISNQIVTIARQGNGALVAENTYLSFRFGEVTNPRADGTTSDFTFRTRTGEGVMIDENEEISGLNIILKTSVIQKPKEIEQPEEIVPSVEELPEELAEEIKPAILPFNDTAGHWAQSFIQKIAERNIVQGKRPGQYAPNDNISRAELLKIAINAFQYEIPEVTQPPLPDVSVDSWYAPYVKSAFKNNLISGFEEGLIPNEMASRGMAITVLAKAAGLESQAQAFYENERTTTFPDVSVEEYYTPYIAYLHSEGIIHGYENGTFGPENPITRAEIAKIVVNLLEKSKQ